MHMRDRFTIQDWAAEERPREKFIGRGAESLSDAELLAILIRSGNKDENAIDLSRKILREAGNSLHNLKKFSYHDFKKFRGVGPGKALSIMAAFEIARRCEISGAPKFRQIYSSQAAASVVVPMLQDLPHEECWVLFLNKANKLIGKQRISSGGLDTTAVDIRVVIRHALEKNSCHIILVHNHPSGNLRPSRSDEELTVRVNRASQTVNIRMVDHVIVTDGDYYSFAENGKI